MKKYLKKILSVSTNIIIILLVVCLLANSQSLLFGKKYNNLFGYSLLEIETASMKGTMEIGDWILIEVTDEVKLNDIITYETDGALITHRLVEIQGNNYIAKGDSNNTKDVPIKKDQIVGKVIKIMPKFGIIKKTILNEKVLFIVALILIVSASFVDENSILRKKSKLIKKDEVEDKEETKKEEFKIEELPPSVRKNVTKITFADLSKTRDLSKTVLLSKVTVDIGENNYKKLVLDGDLSKTLVDFKINNVINNEVKEEIIEEPVVVEEKDLSKIDIDIEDNKFSDAYKKVKEQKEIEEASKVEENILEEKKEEPINEEDNNEIDESLKEAAKKEIDSVKLEEPEEKEEEINFIDEEENKKEVNVIGLTNKNLINKNIELKKLALKEMIMCILSIEKIDGRLSAISNKAITKYIDIKYLQQCENANVERKDFNKLIGKQLEAFFDNMLEENKDVNVINKVREAFMIINAVDFEKPNIEKIVNDSSIENKDKVIKGLNQIIKNFDKIYKEFFDKIFNDKFDLQTKRIAKKSTSEALYATNLSSRIQFSKVFSDYIIEKSYQKDIIAEDLREVQLKLVSIKLLNDMLSFEYNKKYIIAFPESLYSKPKKINSILSNVDDQYSQSKIYYVVDLETLKLYNDTISKLKVKGYKFIVEVPTNNLKLIDNIKKYLFVADYLLITGGTISKKEKTELIPSYLHEKIIYIDKTIIEEVIIK